MEQLQKKMCKMAKEGLKGNEEALIAELLNPRFVCKKCLRVSTSKDLLCSPKKMKRNKI